MTIKTKSKKLAILLSNPDILFSKKKYLFIISHMRSRSSVLCHILGNNPEICGYKELHQSYKGKISLLNMQIELVKELNCNLKNKYLLDKLLNNFTITNEFLHKINPKLLFLLREPESTIKSIINMGNKIGVEWYKDPVKVTNYYCKRMDNMLKLKERLNNNYICIESDDLIQHSEETLTKITNWLDLEVPLDTKYSAFKGTGLLGYGDPLENIKAGKLIVTSGYADIKIPKILLKKAEESYQKCKMNLLKNV